MDMNNNAMVAASQRGVRRFIFASSNHLYGRYWRCAQ
jgi:nucleoside-diphosphate-sugar epimerase